jgi:hypothetical protein
MLSVEVECTLTVTPVYNQEIDDNCQVQLAKAKNVWAANQTAEGANAAGDIISNIDSGAANYKDVKVFVVQTAKKIKEIAQRNWDYQLKPRFFFFTKQRWLVLTIYFMKISGMI